MSVKDVRFHQNPLGTSLVPPGIKPVLQHWVSLDKETEGLPEWGV